MLSMFDRQTITTEETHVLTSQDRNSPGPTHGQITRGDQTQLLLALVNLLREVIKGDVKSVLSARTCSQLQQYVGNPNPVSSVSGY